MKITMRQAYIKNFDWELLQIRKTQIAFIKIQLHIFKFLKTSAHQLFLIKIIKILRKRLGSKPAT